MATYMDVTPEEKQEILETIDLSARMDKVARLLMPTRIEDLAALARDRPPGQGVPRRAAARGAVARADGVAIQRQLGEGDEGKAAEIAELDAAITKAQMPKEVDEQARKELRRLQRMPEAAGEYGMVRSYPGLADRAALGAARGSTDPRHQ